MSKILILANHYNTLRIFRRELLQELYKQGHDVIVSMPESDADNKNQIESYGCKVIFTPVERRGMNPVKDLKLLFDYIQLLRKEKPDKVITYTIKPNIYGSLACKTRHIPHYANVTGLGSAFQAQGGIMRKWVSFLYKISLNKATKVFFENEGNKDTLVCDGIIRKEQAVVMPGAGVNLDEFYKCDYCSTQQETNFLFIGRIMREKGVDELFETIKRVKKLYSNIKFTFIGWYEDSYQSIVEQLEEQGMIEFHGFQLEVRPFIEKAHCVILPSWHEGMSNTLLEAAAMCRPLITTNIHGCKEAVIDGHTGYLVELRDAESLFEKICEFIELSYEEKKQMGQAGRKHMIDVFDKYEVVKRTMKEMMLDVNVG